jgi:hypothetical protein
LRSARNAEPGSRKRVIACRTFQFIGGDLVHRDLTSLETPGGGSLPFDTRELLARLDDEPGERPVGG